MNAQIINGTYTVVSAKTGDHRTVAIMDDDFEWMTSFRPAVGTRVIKAMLGSDNERLTSIGTLAPTGEIKIWSKHTSKLDFIAAVKYLLVKGPSNEAQFGKNYAIRSGKCFLCNRKLTTPASTFFGYGPDCAEREGLPYDKSAGTSTGDASASPSASQENAQSVENAVSLTEAPATVNRSAGRNAIPESVVGPTSVKIAASPTVRAHVNNIGWQRVKTTRTYDQLFPQ